MQKPGVRSFKNELRNYRYYVSRVVDLGEKIDLCYHRLGGVRAVDPGRIPVSGMPNKDAEYKTRDDIERYTRLKALYQAKLDEMDRILGLIEKEMRDALVRVYVDGEQIRKVADMYFLSHNGLAKRINRAIEKAMEE